MLTWADINVTFVLPICAGQSYIFAYLNVVLFLLFWHVTKGRLQSTPAA